MEIILFFINRISMLQSICVGSYLKSMLEATAAGDPIAQALNFHDYERRSAAELVGAPSANGFGEVRPHPVDNKTRARVF